MTSYANKLCGALARTFSVLIGSNVQSSVQHSFCIHYSKADFTSVDLQICGSEFNPLDSKGNYSATSDNTKLVHWPLMGGLLHLVQRGGGTGRRRSPPEPLLAVPNVTAHPSTDSVPITVLLYMDRCSAILTCPSKG